MMGTSFRFGFVACVVGAIFMATGASSAFEPPIWGYAVDNGDVNGDQGRDLSDPIYLLDHLFLGGPPPLPLAYCDADEPVLANGDSNGDGTVDLSDGVYLLAWLFSGGPEPADACLVGDGSGAHGKSCRNRVAPPGCRAYGKTLAQWLATYWAWYFGTGGDEAQSFVGRVKLLPIPSGDVLGGSFTPEDPLRVQGHVEVQLRPGTPFVLPQFAWSLERYDPALGIPDDPPFPDDLLLASVSPNMTIDGCTVVNDANERRFYVPPTPFHPPVEYPEPTSYGSIAIVAFQGCGLVGHPLAPGDHEIHLYEPYIVSSPPAGVASFGIIYDNTWSIHVSSH